MTDIAQLGKDGRLSRAVLNTISKDGYGGARRYDNDYLEQVRESGKKRSVDSRNCLTNKVRLCERSEPQSEPFVGQARTAKWWSKNTEK
jgi:capsid portal protein